MTSLFERMELSVKKFKKPKNRVNESQFEPSRRVCENGNNFAHLRLEIRVAADFEPEKNDGFLEQVVAFLKY